MVTKESLRSLARACLGPLLAAGVSVFHGGSSERIRHLLSNRPKTREGQCPFPIDIVYTWVDDTDVDWQQRKSYYWNRDMGRPTHAAAHPSRFHNRDELRFSLRSVSEYASFVRKVYVVTDNQCPQWLNTENPRLILVSHHDILPSDALPTFNSHAIEARLHHIPGLSEHYIYMNDDFFFGRPASPLDYFTTDGMTIDYQLNQTVPFSTPSSADTGLVVSMKNSAQLLHNSFGATIRNKLAHVPHSQLRSVLHEIEALYRDTIDKTIHSKFKDVSGVSVPSALYPYYASCSHKGVLRSLATSPYRYKYVNTASPFLKPILRHIYLSKNFHTFCINEPISEIDTTEFDSLVTEFLKSYFPRKSEFEH